MNTKVYDNSKVNYHVQIGVYETIFSLLQSGYCGSAF